MPDYRLIFLAAPLLLPAAPANACSCAPQSNAGFVHTAVTHLPANARGALFQLPARSEIVAREGGKSIYRAAPYLPREFLFDIRENGGADPLPAKVEPLDIQSSRHAPQHERAYKFAAAADLQAYLDSKKRPSIVSLIKAGKLADITGEVQRATGLARIAPLTGFRSGATYTITYNGLDADEDRRKVTHTIDAAVLDTGSLDFRLALDGPPTRQLLQQPASGMCSSSQPALVQDFHFVLPESYAAYRSALSYRSYRSSGVGGKQVANVYYRALCERREFAVTARGEAQDFVATDCAKPAKKLHISGEVGFLEVEDRLHDAGSIDADMSLIRGSACSASAILGDAVKSGDQTWAERALCLFGSRRFDPWSEAPALETPPPPTQLLGLRLAPQSQSCLLDTLASFSEYLDDAEARQRMLELFRQQLLAPEEHIRNQARQNLSQLLPRDEPPLRKRLRQELFAELVDANVDEFLQYHDDYGNYLESFLRAAGAAAHKAAPRLRADIEGDAPDSSTAIRALAASSDDIESLRSFLLACTNKPKLREAATMVYVETADQTVQQQALALLTGLAGEANATAIQKLGEMGPAALASAPVVLQALRSGESWYVRGEALDAILRIDPANAALLDAVNDALAAPGESAVDLALVAQHSEQLKPHAALMRGLKASLSKPTSGKRLGSQAEMAAVIRQLELSREQQQELLQLLK